ncbi:hypothetical protein PF005_g31265 [Phytophthora fragariae]|uniref:Orn/DAP/Arg decarboxylase 2 N-terminal domain-containing protein n=2 Tax=Phytophthora fragariae TaxID=53985 RepID=A0A6A3V5R2_9STRA|nr:hypothetical protein PF005_g31265 [Phytophthora fragariae]
MARRDRRRDADGLRLGPTCEQKGLAVDLATASTASSNAKPPPELQSLGPAPSSQRGAFYVVNTVAVEDRFKLWHQHQPTVRPHYAVKCNPDPSLIEGLARLGAHEVQIGHMGRLHLDLQHVLHDAAELLVLVLLRNDLVHPLAHELRRLLARDALTLLVAVALVVRPAEFQEEGDVLVLLASNFDEVVSRHDTLLVEF